MKAIVKKTFYDVAMNRTLSQGAQYESSDDVQFGKLVKEGFIEAVVEKQPAKKKAVKGV